MYKYVPSEVYSDTPWGAKRCPLPHWDSGALLAASAPPAAQPIITVDLVG